MLGLMGSAKKIEEKACRVAGLDISRGMSNATASNILEFPAPMKAFRHIAWNGKIASDCGTIPFRRATTNPDASKFEEIPMDAMKSARGTAATMLYVEGGVQIWGWL